MVRDYKLVSHNRTHVIVAGYSIPPQGKVTVKLTEKQLGALDALKKQQVSVFVKDLKTGKYVDAANPPVSKPTKAKDEVKATVVLVAPKVEPEVPPQPEVQEPKVEEKVAEAEPTVEPEPTKAEAPVVSEEPAKTEEPQVDDLEKLSLNKLKRLARVRGLTVTDNKDQIIAALRNSNVNGEV